MKVARQKKMRNSSDRLDCNCQIDMDFDMELTSCCDGTQRKHVYKLLAVCVLIGTIHSDVSCEKKLFFFTSAVPHGIVDAARSHEWVPSLHCCEWLNRMGTSKCNLNAGKIYIFIQFILTVWAPNLSYRRAALRCSFEVIWMFHVPPANGYHWKLHLLLCLSHNLHVAMIIDNLAM